MDDADPLAYETELPIDPKSELRAYASRLKADFERQKSSRAAGRHARYCQLHLITVVLTIGPRDLQLRP